MAKRTTYAKKIYKNNTTQNKIIVIVVVMVMEVHKSINTIVGAKGRGEGGARQCRYLWKLELLFIAT